MQESDDDASKPDSASPEREVEQLLKSLELQRSAQMGRKLPEPVSGMAFRYFTLVLVILGTMAAVAFLEWFASQLPKPHRVAAPALQASPAGSPGSP